MIPLRSIHQSINNRAVLDRTVPVHPKSREVKSQINSQAKSPKSEYSFNPSTRQQDKTITNPIPIISRPTIIRNHPRPITITIAITH